MSNDYDWAAIELLRRSLTLVEGERDRYREDMHIAKQKLATAIAMLERINGRAQTATETVAGDWFRALQDIRLMCAEELNKEDGNG